MGRLEIKFSREAAKQYKKLPKEYKSLVEITLFRISEGLELDLKPVGGEKDVTGSEWVSIGCYLESLIKLC